MAFRMTRKELNRYKKSLPENYLAGIFYINYNPDPNG
jgi:hypothetical protein